MLLVSAVLDGTFDTIRPNRYNSVMTPTGSRIAKQDTINLTHSMYGSNVYRMYMLSSSRHNSQFVQRILPTKINLLKTEHRIFDINVCATVAAPVVLEWLKLFSSTLFLFCYRVWYDHLCHRLLAQASFFQRDYWDCTTAVEVFPPQSQLRFSHHYVKCRLMANDWILITSASARDSIHHS
jgi:hypothetical protein